MVEKWSHQEILLSLPIHPHTREQRRDILRCSAKNFFTFDWRNREGFRMIIAGGVGLALSAEK